MKRNMKIMLSALSVMLIMALAVTVLSFSLAGDGNTAVTQNANFGGVEVGTKTNIDYIIENASSTDASVDTKYRIVEIGSGTASKGFDVFVRSNDFEQYVIEGNRTIADLMKDGQVDYKYYQAKAVADENTEALAAISNADFIYVSNDTNSPYAPGNDMGEKLYDILHTYAVGDYKPLIIDKTSSLGGSPSGSTSNNTYTVPNLASLEYDLYGRYYYTFSWDTSKTAQQFFQRDGSMYLSMNGEKKSVNWSEVSIKPSTPPAEGTKVEIFDMAEILVITADAAGTDKAMSTKILEGCTPVTDTLIDENASEVTGNVYNIKNTVLYNDGYNNGYVKPTYARVTYVDMANIGTQALDIYDMVIIEESCKSVTIDKDKYMQLAAAMYAKVTVVYSKAMSVGGSSGSSGGTGDIDEKFETNFAELFYMVATTDGQTKYQNIMIPNSGQLDIIMNSDSATTCKILADLINASSYRGIGGPKGSSSKFTVLEIQPCYPIDEELAYYIGHNVKSTEELKNGMNTSTFLKNLTDPYKFGDGGNYYVVPSEVVNGKTKEELNEYTEYYAWELSKAKIAAAYGMSVDQINLVQVSTEELASMKEDILGNYDLVYVGGNTTALKQAIEYKGYIDLAGWGGVIADHHGVQNITRFPIYTMYTHSGEILMTNLAPLSEGGSATGQYPTATVEINGQKKNNVFTLANGNDITYSKLQQLKEYVDADMPIVFSTKATEAYKAVNDFGYLQNSIDPDCNMYKFMKYCGATNATGVAVNDNILWDFNVDNINDKADNNGGDYGETKTGYVTIFNEAEAQMLQDLYLNSSKRPKLSLTNMPATYNLYDKSSYITNKTLSFAYDVTGSASYSVELYVDDNGNSVFESDEGVTTATDQELAKGTLEFKVGDNFYGPLYWKLVVTDTSGIEASTTGICYVSDTNSTKQAIKILQIMPGEAGTPGAFKDAAGEGAQGNNSLYFCTICQQAYQRLEYNPSTGTGSRDDFESLYDGHARDHDNGKDALGENYIGKHEHEFGIVAYDSTQQVKYQNTLYYGADDWDVNLADEVRDKYSFDIDIMLRSEFVDMSYAVEAAYDVTNLSAADKATIVLANPYEEETDNYKAYAAATTTVDEKLAMLEAAGVLDERISAIYADKADEAVAIYDNLNGLVTATEADFNASFANYPYKDELEKEITVFTPEQKAQLTYAKSALDAEIELRTAIEDLRDTVSSDPTSFDYQELDRLLTTRHYWDYFSIRHNNTPRYYAYGQYSEQYGGKVGVVKEKYAAWVKLKDIQIDAEAEYEEYNNYANGADWLLDGYDMILIGASNDFAGDDFVKTGTKEPAAVALADLKNYINEGGNILMFHDTLSAWEDAGSKYLTAAIRECAGMDRYHMELDASKTDNLANSYYLPYKTTSSQGSEVYFMTDLSPYHYGTQGEVVNAPAGYNKYSSWYNQVASLSQPMGQYYLSPVAYTDSSAILSNTSNTHVLSSPYMYAEISWTVNAYWANDIQTYITGQKTGRFGTNRASKTNEGIVTMYPFTLSDQLNISATHAQVYALDLEDTDLTVWYSLAGGTGQKLGSSFYAASPNDGMDSYFIYTYKNFNYCGAGHTDVTGIWKDNNDERRLYINIICNSVRKSVKQPDIFVYDYATEENEKYVKTLDGYTVKVSETNEYPEFSVLVRLDQDADIKTVRMYYDLDYLTAASDKKDLYTADDNHILIANWTDKNITAGTIRDIYRYDSDLIFTADEYDVEGDDSTRTSMLKLRPEYFDPYNGQYTYIVIEVEDTLGNVTYQRIKIELRDKLFNLT